MEKDSSRVMADFRPAVDAGSTSGRGTRFRISRSVVVIIVIGAHVVAGAMFAFPVLQRVISDPVPEEEPGPPVAHVDMVISQERVEAPRVGAGSETRPPKLKSTETATPVDRAKRAGIALAASARATLLVRVSEEGKPGEVTVAESSGDARLDQVAVEYARSLEWSPALVSGRASTMSIQLPVEFRSGS